MGSTSRDRGAAGRRSVGRDDQGTGLETERQPAVAAGGDPAPANDLAFRAPDQEPCLVDVATLGAVGIDQAVERAIRLARGHDPSPEMIARREAGALVITDLDPRLRDPVA